VPLLYWEISAFGIANKTLLNSPWKALLVDRAFHQLQRPQFSSCAGNEELLLRHSFPEIAGTPGLC
jgi:hypothetical protein